MSKGARRNEAGDFKTLDSGAGNRGKGAGRAEAGDRCKGAGRDKAGDLKTGDHKTKTSVTNDCLGREQQRRRLQPGREQGRRQGWRSNWRKISSGH